MSGITTIWNQSAKPQDMSEVWSPSEEDGFQFLLENSEPGRYPKHVIIENHIGYMIMPGIYCFGKYEFSDFQPAYLSNWAKIFRCARKSAMLGYYLSDGHMLNPPSGFALLYLAIDQENIEILKKMNRTLGNYLLIENEVFETAEEQTAEKDPDSLETLQKSPKEDLVQLFPEDAAEELMPGLGIRDIRVGLKRIFSCRLPVTKYEYAYKSVDKLILIPYDRNKTDRQEYDLSILEELTVRRTEALRCGILIDRDYFLIDCGVQKAKQVLTPEAYELFRKNKILE